MGEQRAVREGIVGNQVDGIYWGLDGLDGHLSTISNIICLRTFYPDNLICAHEYAFGYNNCKFNSILKATLMIKSKSISGDISNDC
jgi:hypothetical protein